MADPNMIDKMKQFAVEITEKIKSWPYKVVLDNDCTYQSTIVVSKPKSARYKIRLSTGWEYTYGYSSAAPKEVIKISYTLYTRTDEGGYTIASYNTPSCKVPIETQIDSLLNNIRATLDSCPIVETPDRAEKPPFSLGEPHRFKPNTCIETKTWRGDGIWMARHFALESVSVVGAATIEENGTLNLDVYVPTTQPWFLLKASPADSGTGLKIHLLYDGEEYWHLVKSNKVGEKTIYKVINDLHHWKSFDASKMSNNDKELIEQAILHFLQSSSRKEI